ncbi:unnamed protein product, partial [Owenia fusiformis]
GYTVVVIFGVYFIIQYIFIGHDNREQYVENAFTDEPCNCTPKDINDLSHAFIGHASPSHAFSVHTQNSKNNSKYKMNQSMINSTYHNEDINIFMFYKVVYNRLAKCGSTSVITILQNLVLKNGFALTDRRGFGSSRSVVNEVVAMASPGIYIKHHDFINFTSYNTSQPVFINIIRHPVDRAISSYYYTRWQQGVFNQTLEECIARFTYSYCAISTTYSLDRLCGTKCTLEQTKKHIEKYYFFIGVVEHFNSTMDALELILPLYFKGWKSVAEDCIDLNTAHMKKTPPSENTLKKLKFVLSSELELYNFILQRFHRTLKNLNIF